jgi:hypothetical protein
VWQELTAEHNRLLRFWIISSLAGGIMAYVVLITANVVWGLPHYPE